MAIILKLLLFCAADRFSGSGLVARWKWRGRPIYYAGVVVLAAGGAAWWAGQGWDLLAIAANWTVWRLPSWDLKVGKKALLPRARIDPRTWSDIGQTFVRHLPLALPAVWGHPLCLATPFIATGLAITEGLQAHKRELQQAAGQPMSSDLNSAVEAARGAAAGALLALKGLP